MNTNVLRSYADTAAKYPGALSGETLLEALAEIDSNILKGRYRGVAIVEYRRVLMPSGRSMICNVCVECRDISTGRKRQIPLPSFLQSYTFVAGDPASI